jgi:hypothetical protein
MKVQSFDFWDTLVAREALRPTDIFQYMKEENNLPSDFLEQRILAEQKSTGGFDTIYNELQTHYNWSNEYKDYVKNLELVTEIRYIIPVQENLNRVNDGDIIVSDMYLPEEAFRNILKFIGFEKNVTFYISNGGKYNGTIWPELLKKYTIELHLGDNPHSDIATAKKFLIPTELTTITEFTKAEMYFIQIKELMSIGHILRRLRLASPFSNKIEKAIWFDMMNHIIPVAVFFCNFIDTIAKQLGLKKLRFLTRDNILIQRIFDCLYPNYDTSIFISSRYLNTSNDIEYEEYVKKNYDDNTLLIDLHGSFNSGRPLFLKLFKKLPNIVLFSFHGDIYMEFKTCFFKYRLGEIQYTYSYEKFVQPYHGKSLGFRQTGTIIRDINEYSYGHVVQRAIDMFVNSILKTPFTEQRLDFDWLKTFINETPLQSIYEITHPDKIDHNLIKKPIKYLSQIGQDKYFIECINNGKQNGFFVDVGAHNGISFSNTYVLEKHFNWKGLCIEMDNILFDKLKNNRSSKCVNECVFSQSGLEKVIEVPLANPIAEGNDMLIRIKDLPLYKDGNFFDPQFNVTRNYIKITKTLTHIFKENNVPSVIDYMSIDIVGSDLDAIKGLDFDSYKIQFLTIEWGGRANITYLDEISAFLTSKGYVLHRINHWDAEFMPKK